MSLSKPITAQDANQRVRIDLAEKDASEMLGLSVHYLRHVLPEEIEQVGPLFGHTCTSGGGSFCGKAAAECSAGPGPPTPHDINRPVLQGRSKDVQCPRDGNMGSAWVDCVAQETPRHTGRASVMLSI